MPSSTLTKSALALCGAGAALHLYTVVFKAAGGEEGAGASAFLIGLWVFSCAPYAISAWLARGRWAAWALGAAAACLVADLYMHYSVFVAPAGSTAALGLLFMPLWNLVIIGPAGALLAGAVHWAWRRKAGAAG